MPKEVLVRSWCDAHHARGEQVEQDGQQTLISIDGSATRGLLLCDTCRKELTGALLDLLDDYGQAAEPIQVQVVGNRRDSDSSHYKRAKQVTCPFCLKVMTQGGAVGHVYAVHLNSDRPKQPLKCLDCGYRPSADSGLNPATGMGVHRSMKHGFDALAEAIQAARDAGLVPARVPHSKSDA